SPADPHRIHRPAGPAASPILVEPTQYYSAPFLRLQKDLPPLSINATPGKLPLGLEFTLITAGSEMKEHFTAPVADRPRRTVHCVRPYLRRKVNRMMTDNERGADKFFAPAFLLRFRRMREGEFPTGNGARRSEKAARGADL